MIRDFVQLTINGKVHRLRGDYAFRPLSDLLRYELAQTGTKVVCAEGDCGACTVMMAKSRDLSEGFQSINSCIYTGFLADGAHIVTVEDLKENGELNEVQKSMVRNFGGQCGFCTPGFVMSIMNMYESKSDHTEQNIKNYMTGNLCRCTGYQPIIDAAKDVDLKKHVKVCDKREWTSLQSQFEGIQKQSILMKHGNQEFYAPTSIAEAIEYKSKNSSVRIFSGATDLGVQINKGKKFENKMMSLHLIEDLYGLENNKGTVRVGARVSLGRLQELCEDVAPEFGEFLNIFASPQIKNSGTLVGNIANGSPIADTIPFIIAMNGRVIVEGEGGERSIPIDEFYLDYKKLNITPDEIIKFIEFDCPLKDSSVIKGYKISQRRDLDIACVNACFHTTKKGSKIENVRIALGGVAATPLRLKGVEDKLRGREINGDTLELLREEIGKSINPLSDVRGSSEFRMEVIKNLASRYFAEELSS